MRKFLLLFFTLFISATLFAQLEVKPGSFKEVSGFVNINSDPNYQTDDNELPFAVIRVRTENINDKQRRELRFSGNAGTFIVLEYKDGEVWVYLTAKYAEYLKISHPDFSSIEFPIPFDLQPKKGYEMTLVNNEKIETGVGSLTIRTKPDGAMIALNGININQQTPYVNDMMAAGTYTITVSKSKYKSETRTVKLENGAKETVVIDLVYDIADITVKVDNDVEVYIDGVMFRKGTWIGELESGIHTIECRKLYHKPVIKTITVVANRPQTYTFVPTPIYGNAEINTEPQGANVFIDNRYYGTTPLITNQIIIGTHEMTIEKSGYRPLEKTVFLEECNNIVINEKLSVGMANRTFTVNGVSFEMVAVEGGTFLMGAQKTNFKGANYDEESQNNELPVHQVTLSDYYIGMFEVTQDIWTVVMGSNPKNLKGDKYPVNEVTWLEAVEFCNKLSERCGRKPYYYNIQILYNKNSESEWSLYLTEDNRRKAKKKYNNKFMKIVTIGIDTTSDGFRLPTEAEWEFAAKGGIKTKHYKYSGSNNQNDVGWFEQNEDQTHIVGTKQPNELGVYDMSGNVLEWCFDQFVYYNDDSLINPMIIPENGVCVVRGKNSVTSRLGREQIEEKEHKYSNYHNKRFDEWIEYTSSMHYVKAKGCGFRLVLNN